MNIKTSILALTKFEKCLWAGSAAVVSLSFILCGSFDFLTLVTSLIGVTALIFTSKGDPLGQVLIIVFSIGYGIISWQLKYYGEMITYLGMTSPIAAASVYTWLKNPFGSAQVRVASLSKKQGIIMVVLTILVTCIFYFILAYFNTAVLWLSTISITTSFLASYLTVVRSKAYAAAYAANDIVLTALWLIAFFQNPAYLPVVICFVMFFVNDVYGFINWQRIKKNQGNT